jgi:DNA-binding IclR family transcriptional regulator
MEGETPRPAYHIESVDNALRLLLMFQGRRSVRVSEISAEMEVARSTAHRLVAMLQYHGFVAQDPVSRAYVAGPALVNVGLAVVRDMDIRIHARAYLERLCARTGETVHLVVLQGNRVLFLDSVESERPLRVVSRAGMTLPAHSTSVGKALLADLSPERLRLLYPRPQLEVVTKKTVRSRASLERELDATRRRGYSVNHEESEEGVCSVGVAVRDRGGQARAAFSVALPITRWSEEQAETLAAATLDEASALGGALP